MAITYNAMNAKAALQKMGVTPGWIEEHQAAGLSFTLTAKGLLVGKDQKATLAPVSLDMMKKLATGAMSETEKLKLVEEVTHAADQALHAEPAANAAPAESPASPLAKLKQSVPGVQSSAQAPTQWEEFPLDQQKSAGTVQLRYANRMYQPVSGTSAGSRYFLVGGNKDIRIAARLSGTELAVRVEGPFWQKYLKNITEVGFSKVEQAKGYASLHLSVDSQMMAAKALGAILVGLEIPLETPVPDFKRVAV